MGIISTLEELRRVIKIFHEEWKWILINSEFSFGIWRALACPLCGECTLTLLVSQFQESEILIQVSHGRGHSDLWSFMECFIADRRL